MKLFDFGPPPTVVEIEIQRYHKMFGIEGFKTQSVLKVVGDRRRKDKKLEAVFGHKCGYFSSRFDLKPSGEGRRNTLLPLVGTVTCGGGRYWWQRR